MEIRPREGWTGRNPVIAQDEARLRSSSLAHTLGPSLPVPACRLSTRPFQKKLLLRIPQDCQAPDQSLRRREERTAALYPLFLGAEETPVDM